ncbi:MAG: CDP-glucose 4,6-dehydratase [Armatimonadetes bacterium]|nr:CDP-glucose 4,6-dehydratase [Armatimonadota bacterium]
MTDPFGGFYRRRRVFLTGHTGFKGSWLTQWLVDLGAVVRGYSLEPPTEPALFHVLDLEKRIEHRVDDVRDASKLRAEVQGFQPEVIFHLAAQPLVRLSYREPRLTFETNVLGTVNLYEAVRACESVRAVVCVTTDKCYQNEEWVWGYRETDRMGGHDPYSASKACVELLSEAYRNCYFRHEQSGGVPKVALATVRAGNVIGGGDWAADRLVPDCVRALSRGERILVRNPKAIRPWQHVLEPLSGYLLLAERMYAQGDSFSDAWNFGPGDAGNTNVEDVVEKVISAWGSGEYRIAPDAEMHEASMLKLDISKARAVLRWRPRLEIHEAIEQTIDIYKAYYAERDTVRARVSAQIERFSDLCDYRTGQ